MGLSRRESGVGCHALLQEMFPTAGIEPTSLVSPALADGFFTTSTTCEAQKKILGPLPTLLGVGTLKARIPKAAHGITYLHLGVHSFPFPDPVAKEETQAFVVHSVSI